MTRVGRLMVTLFGALTIGLGISPVALSQQGASFDRGLAEMGHRDFDGAINSFSEAIGFNMNNTEAYFKRGQCYYYLKLYAKALSDFQYLLKMSPRDSQAMLWEGTAYARMGDEQKSVQSYLHAMRVDPQLVVQYQQGNGQNAHSTNPHNEGAVGAYEKAVQLYISERGLPTGAPATPVVPAASPAVVTTEQTVVETSSVAKSNISPAGIEKDSSMNEPELRIEQLDAAIKADPSNAVLHFRRGIVNKRLGNLDKALADFSEAINLDPMKSRFYLARARLYHEQNQPDLAQADIKKAHSVDPTVPTHFKFAGQRGQ